ncbi:chaperonin 10-like protein [Phlebopus sp. FC_14]|nr:chaperonin 10-like protein [Phlebopus sp. FC_14]
MSAQQQKALLLPSKHGKLVVGEREVPRPGRGQLLVKVGASGLNPIDYKIQDTGIFIEEYPAVLGVDISGVVEEVGEGAGKFVKGDKVQVICRPLSLSLELNTDVQLSFAHGQHGGDEAAFQQFALTVGDFTAKIPSSLDFDQAATVPLGFDTAASGLYADKVGAALTPPWEHDGKGKYTGNPIFIVGGSGSVGSYAIQLARLSGFAPIITTASLTHASYLKSIGATDVIDRHLSAKEVKAAVVNITRLPIEVAYDTTSLPSTQKLAWSILADNGILVVTLQPVVKEEEGKGRKVIATFGSPHAPGNHELFEASWSVLGKWLEEGVIQANRLEILPNGLHGIDGGLQRMRKGQVSGTKLVAHPQEAV